MITYTLWLLPVDLERIFQNGQDFSDKRKKWELNKIPEDLLFKDTSQIGDLKGGGGIRDCHLGKYLGLLTNLEHVAWQGYEEGEETHILLREKISWHPGE